MRNIIFIIFFALVFSLLSLNGQLGSVKVFAYDCWQGPGEGTPDPCDRVPEPDCEGVYCSAYCFDCHWEECNPYWFYYRVVCCDPGAGSGTCKLTLAHCVGEQGCCADPNCDPDEACPFSWMDNFISNTVGEAIAEHGCCLGRWTWRHPNCSVYHSYNGIPYFCAECCDKVTTEFIAYTTPVFIGNPYFADCASIHDCFRDDLNQWWNSECGEVGIAEVDEEYCCGCETG